MRVFIIQDKYKSKKISIKIYKSHQIITVQSMRNVNLKMNNYLKIGLTKKILIFKLKVDKFKKKLKFKNKNRKNKFKKPKKFINNQTFNKFFLKFKFKS